MPNGGRVSQGGFLTANDIATVVCSLGLLGLTELGAQVDYLRGQAGQLQHIRNEAE
jgi:hypothetical protein